MLDTAEIAAERAFTGTLAEGADCSPSHTDYSNVHACAPGLYCYVSDLGDSMNPPRAECRRIRAEGETCEAGPMDCGPGLTCAPGATVDDPGTCLRLLPDGAPCEADEQCASDLCSKKTATCEALNADDTWCTDATLEA